MPTRQPLTNDEKSKLANIAEFNASHGRRQFALRDREAPGLNLAGIQLNSGTLENIAFGASNLRASGIRFSKLRGCEFKGALFDASAFDQSEFFGCTFDSIEPKTAKWQNSIFNACTFKNCEFTESNFAESKFSGCTFTNCTWKLSILTKTSFDKCTLDFCIFRRGDVSDAAFSDSTLKKCRFIQLMAYKFSITGGEISRTGFEEGMLTQATIKAAAIDALVLDGATFDSLSIEDAPKAYGMKIRSSTLKSLKFKACRDMIEPCFTESKVEGFEATACQFIVPRFAGSKLEKGILFDQCSFEGADFGEATFVDTTFRACTFQGELNTADAGFVRLKLPAIQYAPDYSAAKGHVTYFESEKFKGT